MEEFEIVGEISHVEIIAVGSKIRSLKELQRKYGKGRWRKLKGVALVRFPSGHLLRSEVHWYEAHGVGRRGFKIKDLLE